MSKSNKILVLVIVVIAIFYFILKYAHSDAQVTDMVGGLLIGMLIGAVWSWISKLFGKKKTSPEE